MTDKTELDFSDIKTIETVNENDDDGTPLGASDVPLEAQKASAEAKLMAGVDKLKDLEDKALSVERELEARGLGIERERDQELGLDQGMDMDLDR